MSTYTLHYIKEKWQHAGFQKYFKNTAWMFLAQFSNLISLSVNIWLARYLGPENYGILSYVFAFVGIFGFLNNLGITDILIRELVRNPEKRDEYLGTAFGLSLFGGFGVFLCIIVSSFALESSVMVRSLIIIYGATSLFSSFGVISSYFQARVEAKKNAIAQIIGIIIVSAFKIFLILSGKGIIWFTFAFILDYFVSATIYLINYRKSGLKISDWKFRSHIAKYFLSISYLVMLSTVAGYLLLRIDQVMVKFYLGDAAVGLYAAAVRLSEIWYFIPGIIASSIFPAIINAKKIDEQLYLKRLKKLFIFLGGSALVIAIPIVLLAPFIVKIMFGPAYAASVPILQIYIWSGIGLFLSIGLNRYFFAEDKLKSIFYYNLFPGIINVILIMILIPTIGLNGAAWATLISYSVGPIAFFAIKKYKKYAQ